MNNTVTPTVEEKARFFGNHIGYFAEIEYKYDNLPQGFEDGKWCISGTIILHISCDFTNRSSVLLTPLSQISDEDAIEVAKMFCNEETAEAGRDLVHYYRSGDLISSSDGVFLTDFLRSKGYAVQYMNYSVEDQIYFGWIKLTH